MKNSRDISDSTAVEAHLHNLMFNASPSSRMTIIKDESATQTFRIIVGVTLLTSANLPWLETSVEWQSGH